MNYFINKKVNKKFISSFTILLVVISLIIPFSFVEAQGGFTGVAANQTRCKTIDDIASFTGCLTDLITKAFIPFIFALTITAFAVGIFNYIKNADNEQKRAESIKLIVWSLVALFFMTSVWAFAAMFAQFWGDPNAPASLIVPNFK